MERMDFGKGVVDFLPEKGGGVPPEKWLKETLVLGAGGITISRPINI